VVKDTIEFLDEEIREQTGLDIHTPWDKARSRRSADPQRRRITPGRKIPWHSPSFWRRPASVGRCRAIAGYDSVNYGLWYDDAQFARVAVRQVQAAKKLGVKKIVLGECGHAHKASMVTADRLLPKDLDIPRESSMTFLRDIVLSGRLKLDPARTLSRSRCMTRAIWSA